MRFGRAELTWGELAEWGGGPHRGAAGLLLSVLEASLEHHWLVPGDQGVETQGEGLTHVKVVPSLLP